MFLHFNRILFIDGKQKNVIEIISNEDKMHGNEIIPCGTI